MDETSAQPEEHMILRYRKVDRNLFGYIAFFRMEHPDREEAITPHRESKPFVIGRYSSRGGRSLEVLGSVVFLLMEMRRLIGRFVHDHHAWKTKRGQLTSETEIADADSAHDQKAMDFVLLVSTHARNLFDLMPRFNPRSIPRLDDANSPDGEVTLRELFDVLIHHRYYYFDGARVRDLFSDDFKKRDSALSGRFMGYGFDILEFVAGIIQVVDDVKIKDLTQLLWRKFKKNFTADSKPQDVVSLVQNVHAFSDLLTAKIPTEGYEFMTRLMFDDLDDLVEEIPSVTLPDGTITQTRKLLFESPRITIASDLNEKQFEIRVRRAVGAEDQRLARKDLTDHRVTIGFEEFLRKVNEAFGDDRLSGTPPPITSGSADGL